MSKLGETALDYVSQDVSKKHRVTPTNSFVEFRKEEVEQSIPTRFEQIVHKYPNHIAVKMGSHILTYAELNASANRVAHAIVRQQGSEPAAPVGLLFEKGASLICCMLGVLKAGKFFVLLDPSFPKPRITAVLEDSQAGLVIHSREAASLVDEAAASHYRLMEFESIDSESSHR